RHGDHLRQPAGGGDGVRVARSRGREVARLAGREERVAPPVEAVRQDLHDLAGGADTEQVDVPALAGADADRERLADGVGRQAITAWRAVDPHVDVEARQRVDDDRLRADLDALSEGCGTE